MPKAGDTYSVILKQTHLEWGTYRRTNTRPDIPGEAYVPIPQKYAEGYNIRLGSCYRAHFSDGYISFIARASGNREAGSELAKQFQGDGDLKAFGRWYRSVNAQVGNRVMILFLDENNIEFTLLK